jgi:hypothetical protein
MHAIDDTQLAALRAKHGEVAVIETEEGDIVLRRPTKAEFKAAWAAGIFDLKMAVNYDALDRCVRDLCVAPDRGQLDGMIEHAPGALLLCLDPIVRLSGMVARERQAKSPAVG